MVAIVTAFKTTNMVRKFVKFMKTRYRKNLEKNLEQTLKDTHHDLRVIRASKMRVVELRKKIIRNIEGIKELQLKEETFDDERH